MRRSGSWLVASSESVAMDLASVERNGLWREAPNKVRACALWPVAFHRHKTGGDALSCPPDPPGDHRQDADATSPLHACILGEGVVD